MKYFVIGHGRSGKDTFCKLLSKHLELKWTSSSWFCAEKVIYPKFKHLYTDINECFEDRVNNRKLWHDLILEYNQPLDRLCNEIFAESDVYCGIRNIDELNEFRKNTNLDFWTIWIERDVPVEETLSIHKENCLIHIDNNGTIEDLQKQIEEISFIEKWEE